MTACGSFSLARAGVASAGAKAPVDGPVVAAAPAVDWWTGEGVSLGNVLFPHFHFNAVYGGTTSERGHELGAGHHDPVEDGWTVQGFELGLSARVSEYFEAYGTYHGYWENEDPNDYDGVFEEWFGKFKNLPGGLELRGGRYLNRFGFHNSSHLHSWDWVDNFLANGRFLGDDGQYSIGGEVTWTVPTPWTSLFTVSVGEAQMEAHGHEEEVGAAEEHEHEEEHGHEEAAFHGEDALFADVLTTAQWTHLWNWNDFHQFRGGASGAWGDNAAGSSTQLYGVHFQYEWRQNGLEAGGAYLRWRTEVLLRDFELTAHEDEHSEHEEEQGEHEDEHSEHEDDHGEHEVSLGTFDDWGFYTSLTYGHPLGSAVIEASLRQEYVSGVAEAGLSERWRLSPGVTWFANSQRTFFIRGQYNHDRFEDSSSEDSVWIGFGFNWGGPEVR